MIAVVESVPVVGQDGALIQEQGIGTQEIFRHCRRCKRTLKNPKYQKLGYGPVCVKKRRGA